MLCLTHSNKGCLIILKILLTSEFILREARLLILNHDGLDDTRRIQSMKKNTNLLKGYLLAILLCLASEEVVQIVEHLLPSGFGTHGLVPSGFGLQRIRATRRRIVILIRSVGVIVRVVNRLRNRVKTARSRTIAPLASFLPPLRAKDSRRSDLA
jgi:hypothetical protein